MKFVQQPAAIKMELFNSSSADGWSIRINGQRSFVFRQIG